MYVHHRKLKRRERGVRLERVSAKLSRHPTRPFDERKVKDAI